MYRKGLFYVQFYFILSLFWVALFETIEIRTFLSGFLFSILITLFIEKTLIKESFHQVLEINLLKLLLYFIILFIEIYKNAFITIYQIITFQINPSVVDIHTELKSNMLKCLLANSITLTPGTVTIDLEEQTLKVLWLNAKSKNSVIAGNMIKGKLERFLNP